VQNPHRKLVQRIREEFEEMPGLRLTLDEASRFLALDESTCRRIFSELSHEGFLARGVDDRFQPVSHLG
jgi:DNA-binding IclR family transcriptional regulator